MDNEDIVFDGIQETLCTNGINEQDLVDFFVKLLKYMYNIFPNHIVSDNCVLLPIPNGHLLPSCKILSYFKLFYSQLFLADSLSYV